MKEAMDTLREIQIEVLKECKQALIELSNATLDYYQTHFEFDFVSVYGREKAIEIMKQSSIRILNAQDKCKKLGITGLDILEDSE